MCFRSLRQSDTIKLISKLYQIRLCHFWLYQNCIKSNFVIFWLYQNCIKSHFIIFDFYQTCIKSDFVTFDSIKTVSNQTLSSFDSIKTVSNHTIIFDSIKSVSNQNLSFLPIKPVSKLYQIELCIFNTMVIVSKLYQIITLWCECAHGLCIIGEAGLLLKIWIWICQLCVDIELAGITT